MFSKNILQVCLSPSWGGLEMVAYETAMDLYANGFNCHTLAASNSPLAQRLKQKNIPVIEIPASSKHLLQNIRLFRQVLESQKIQIVLAQHLRELLLIRLSLIRKCDHSIQLIGFSHTFLNVSKNDFYHRWLYQRVDSLIALTERHQQNLIQNIAIPAQKITIIPNSVDTEQFNPLKRNVELRKSFDPTGKSLLIGLIGRLDKAKGQSTLIKAGALLAKNPLQPFKIILVGEETVSEPGILQDLKGLVKTLHLQDHVVFTGYRSDIPELMASMDIVVMASDAETFGRVNIEAMAAGAVLVATEAGGVMDIVEHFKTGLLFKPRDENELFHRLEYLMEHQWMRDVLAQAALEVVAVKYAKSVVQRKFWGTFGAGESVLSAEVRPSAVTLVQEVSCEVTLS
jgi:glycosyltransferase involved in cell wall biosynthesis